MQGIKALVIFMGVLILAGMVALVYGMVTQVGKLSDKDKDASEIVVPMAGVSSTQETVAPFGSVAAPVPQGATILDTEVSGRTLTLRYRLETGAQEILVFDLTEGKSLGIVTITPAEAAE